MEPAPVNSQADYCSDNHQKSVTDTKKMVIWLEEPAFTHE